MEQHDDRIARAGVAFGLAAYLIWGLVPIYFKAVTHVPAEEVLAHRVLWSVPMLLALVLLQKQGNALIKALRCRRTAVTLLGTTLLIACNWFTFIWAVGNEQVMQASLGYYINPLVNVLLGFVFLGERLRRLQTIAVFLAAIGVTYLTLSGGRFPGLALILAGSFGLYGLLRKVAKVDAVAGLAVETTLLWPVALVYTAYIHTHGTARFGALSWQTDALLLAAGAVTAVPLLLFTAAARRLRLATVGFLQYVAPTGHFILAVVIYGEPFTHTHLVSFACIWTALMLYSGDTVMLRNQLKRTTGVD